MMVNIDYELGGKFWHTNCQRNAFNSGVMRPIAHEPSQSLLECLHCGQRAYYPVGGVGLVCADAQADEGGRLQAQALPQDVTASATKADEKMEDLSTQPIGGSPASPSPRRRNESSRA